MKSTVAKASPCHLIVSRDFLTVALYSVQFSYGFDQREDSKGIASVDKSYFCGMLLQIKDWPDDHKYRFIDALRGYAGLAGHHLSHRGNVFPNCHIH